VSTGWFISPLRRPLTPAEVKRAWRNAALREGVVFATQQGKEALAQQSPPLPREGSG